MKLTELVLSMALATTTAGAGYAAIDLPGRAAEATTATDAVHCHDVANAIAGYLADHETLPGQINDLRPYLADQAEAYQIDGAAVTGPGCRPTRDRP